MKPKVKYRVSGAWLFQPPAGNENRGKIREGESQAQLDFWNRRRNYRNPCGLARGPDRIPQFPPPAGHSKGNRKSSTGCLALNPDRGRPAEIRGKSEPKPRAGKVKHQVPDA